MTPEEITTKLDAINQRLNGAIGRLVLLRNFPVGKEAHDIVLEVGSAIDDLINEILESAEER